MICWRKVLYSYCTTTERSATTRDVSPASLTPKKFDKTPRPTPEYFFSLFTSFFFFPVLISVLFVFYSRLRGVPFLLLPGDSYSSPSSLSSSVNISLCASKVARARSKDFSVSFNSTSQKSSSVCNIFKSLLLLAAFADEEEEEHFFLLFQNSQKRLLRSFFRSFQRRHSRFQVKHE